MGIDSGDDIGAGSTQGEVETYWSPTARVVHHHRSGLTGDSRGLRIRSRHHDFADTGIGLLLHRTERFAQQPC